MHYFSETSLSSLGQHLVALATGLTLLATGRRWLTAQRMAIAPTPANQPSPEPVHSEEWQLFEQSPLAAIAWNVQGEVTRWSDSAAQTFGYSSEEAIGQQATLIVPAHLRAYTSKMWHDVS